MEAIELVEESIDSSFEDIDVDLDILKDGFRELVSRALADSTLESDDD
jgi:hypothetical protein